MTLGLFATLSVEASRTTGADRGDPEITDDPGTHPLLPAPDGTRSRSERMVSMANRSLGRGRVSVPVVGLGTWQQLEAAASRQHRELTQATIAAGTRLIGTSPMYDDAERCADVSTDLVCRQPKAAQRSTRLAPGGR
jgi:hypothetical protein